MSKKKKKSKNYSKLLYESHSGKNKKKSGGGKKDDFKRAKVKGTLDKDERKYMEKEVNKRPKVPEDFVRTRSKCNHNADRLTVAEFRQKSQSGVYTPMLDAMIHVFGEENIRICSSCYEAVLIPEMIPTPEDIEKCMTIVYAACSAMKTSTDKVNEVKAISKMQSRLDKFTKILPMLEKTLKRRDKAAAADVPTGASLSDLNRNFIG